MLSARPRADNHSAYSPTNPANGPSTRAGTNLEDICASSQIGRHKHPPIPPLIISTQPRNHSPPTSPNTPRQTKSQDNQGLQIKPNSA